MYEPLQRNKNKGRSVDNTVVQKKKNKKKGFEVVDNGLKIRL